MSSPGKGDPNATCYDPSTWFQGTEVPEVVPARLVKRGQRLQGRGRAALAGQAKPLLAPGDGHAAVDPTRCAVARDVGRDLVGRGLGPSEAAKDEEELFFSSQRGGGRATPLAAPPGAMGGPAPQRTSTRNYARGPGRGERELRLAHGRCVAGGGLACCGST